ncbi:MAG TPA: ribbon-helix-helix domain-containing protein [Myxococcaceae bacterium]|nr:ribbon-helix-helix domain-containing protein [Myxococcaceae bacterium]
MTISHPTPRLTSVVFRLTRERLEALKTLSRTTRIRQSEYLREAIADVLSKHNAPAVPFVVPPQA